MQNEKSASAEDEQAPSDLANGRDSENGAGPAVPVDGADAGETRAGSQPPVHLFMRPDENGESHESAEPAAPGTAKPGRVSLPVHTGGPEPDVVHRMPPLPSSSRVSDEPPSTSDSPYAGVGDDQRSAITGHGSVGHAVPAAEPASQPETDSSPDDDSAKSGGLLDLQESEELMREVDSGDDGRFLLTTDRVIYQGRSSEGSLFATAAVEDVTSIEFGRRSRDSRSAWWGVVGLLAAIAVWQVTTNETVGAVAGAVVGGISLLLLADYWFRPAGLILRFGTPGGKVEGPVSGKRIRDAEEMAALVHRLRQGDRTKASSAGSGIPPGGSPGLR